MGGGAQEARAEPRGIVTTVCVSSVLRMGKVPLQGLGSDGRAGSFCLPKKTSHVNHRPI